MGGDAGEKHLDELTEERQLIALKCCSSELRASESVGTEK